ncbi:golgin subfamily A member 6-like protein 22 [Drosophila novamexicana]|uniref:golgin subfamily A member 6-like protein 22 n=1 Tax=Drosophila novamexicana TaxID=47314 RepID=UPI0011E5DB59|nr:golgin subfamily A member 6-like protein 22 [Drosophila novamexicana]
MYRPRRTSEFHDDARDDGNVPNKRQTRTQLRSTTSSAHKPSQMLHSNWQPQSRQFSQDRDRGTPLRTGPPPTTKRSVANVNRNSVTPLRHRQASSVERPVVLHTDKKWVQEQSQLIAEYLDEMAQIHALQGFPNEFFSRGGSALRQMTMKQFVGIVNFFLQFIWRNRISVGTNHVEDITRALHKLNYPYQVNKSWLMTPTTQHSFGHVVVMLDFLKDFAPPSPAQQQASGQYEEFPFMETSEQPSYVQNTLDSMALSDTQASSVMLNEETIQLLFTRAADCFAVWDKQKLEEYAVLKRESSDRIIKSLCDLPDTAALDADVTCQQKELQQLEDQLQLHTNNNQEQLEQLRAQDQRLAFDLQTMQNNTKEYRDQIEQLCARSAQNADRMLVLRKERQQLHREVGKQKCSAEEFQRMKVLLNDLENEEQFYKRQMREFTERGYNQQVRLSRAKKHLLDKVEKFNTHAQNIGLDSDICSASEKEKLELVLPLPPQHSDIQARNRRLTKLLALLDKRGAQHEERRRHLEQNIAELTLQNRNLDVELNQLNTQIQSYEQQLAQLHQNFKTNSSMWAQNQHLLEERRLALSVKVEQLQREHRELTELLENKRQQNEETLSDAERRQQERLCARYDFLKKYQETLANGEEKLKEFNAIYKQNELKLANLKMELESIELPPFEDELNEVFKNAKIN